MREDIWLCRQYNCGVLENKRFGRFPAWEIYIGVHDRHGGDHGSRKAGVTLK